MSYVLCRPPDTAACGSRVCTSARSEESKRRERGAIRVEARENAFASNCTSGIYNEHLLSCGGGKLRQCRFESAHKHIHVREAIIKRNRRHSQHVRSPKVTHHTVLFKHFAHLLRACLNSQPQRQLTSAPFRLERRYNGHNVRQAPLQTNLQEVRQQDAFLPQRRNATRALEHLERGDQRRHGEHGDPTNRRVSPTVHRRVYRAGTKRRSHLGLS